MKRILFGGVAAVIALVVFFILISYTGNNNQTSRICFGNSCFSVELALTPEQQAQGLMFRQNLSQDNGMLFVFQQEGIYPFWMKNTLIPLDMIWMGTNGTVVFIAKDVQPCGPGECPTINPGKNAKYVLEVNGGTVERIGLMEGSKAVFEIMSVVFKNF